MLKMPAHSHAYEIEKGNITETIEEDDIRRVTILVIYRESRMS